MKKVLVLILFPVLFLACKTKTVYLPVETVRLEYKDHWLRDSVYLHDSVMIKLKNDTVWIEKYKTIYKERIKRDSVFRNDSIRVPYPVEVEKEVNRLSSLQAFQVWCGRILLLLIIGFSGYLFIKKRFL